MYRKLTNFIVGAFALVLAVPTASAQTQLFTNGNDIYWRIPSIVRMNDGALWAFTDKRYNGAGDLGNGKDQEHLIDIYGRKSFDNGKSWGNAEVVLQSNGNASGANEYLYAFGDAATVVDRESGRILMMAASGQKGVKSTTDGRPFVTRSVYDAGKWLTSNVTDQFYGKNNAYGTHLFVTSGRMVQSTKYKKDKYYRIYAGVCLYSKSASYVVYSDDFGKTWQYLGGYVKAPVQDGDECKVEELPNGDILLFTRKRSADSGRYINVFKFSDIASGAGSWQKMANTGTSQTDGEAYAVANNGEVLLVPAQNSEGKQTYVLLLSGPIGNGRSNVQIFWKELPTDYSNPASYVSGWNKYQVNSGKYYGYTTMVPDRNGDIAFMSELSTWVGPLSFISLPLSTITNGAYTYHESAKGTYHTSSEPNNVQRPTFDVNGGVYTGSKTITINRPEGTTIYYTLDGSDPVVPTATATTAGAKAPRRAEAVTGTQVYKNPITLTEGATTLKAVAVDDYSGNVSQTVTASYLITSAENTNTTSASKQGTTISLDHDNATNLFTNNGSGTFWAYLRHNSTHIQLISSTVSELEPGQQLFHVTNNNMVWGEKPNYYLKLYNGKLSGSTVSQYSYYCILAPKGYRFLRYEIDMDKASENGAKLEEYKYQNGSNTDINVVYSATASNSQTVKMERTLSDGTNVLYFRMDGIDTDQEPIVVQSIKLTYAIDDSFTAQVPNENGTKIHSGFIDLGTFSKGDKNQYNYGFSNSQATDLETVNVVKADGSAPKNVTVDGGNYFMATTDGDYYVEAPAKFRIIGATVNLKSQAFQTGSYTAYTPSASSNGDEIIFQSKDGTKFLKMDDNGNGVSVNSKDEATRFTVTYTNSGYTLTTKDQYLYMTNEKAACHLTSTASYWNYANGGYQYNVQGLGNRYLQATTKGVWGFTWNPKNDPASALSTPVSYTASTFHATAFNREGTQAATNGDVSVTPDGEQTVELSDYNNDAVHINLSGITTGSAALFNVQLQLLPLDPEVSKVEAAAKIGSDVVGNSPVNSYNYVFNSGNIIGVPVPSTTGKDANIDMVFRNAMNEEQTLWYTTGNNQNNPNVKGGYSNVYLIGSTADKDNGLSVISPYPDARTAVDVAGVNKVYATNIADLANASNTAVNTLQDNTVDATTAGNTTVTMTINNPKSSASTSTDGNTFYLYSADQPTYQIMPQSLAQAKHIDFRFFTIKVKPVAAEKPNIEIIPIYTSTMKGAQHKSSISSDGNELDKTHTYVGVKVTAVKDASASTSYNALTAEDIYEALKKKLSSADYANQIYAGDPLRTVLYVDMSALSTVTTANTTTMGKYKTETADNCLFFMPQGFAGTGLGNVISKMADGTYRSFGDVRLYDQQPFYTPYAFNTGTYKAIYEREGTVKGETVKAKVRNMAAVLPFDISLDGAGHPYLDGNDQSTSYITFHNITGSGKLTGVRKDSDGKPLTYAVVASPVDSKLASANTPYYVTVDKDHDAGFTFNIPGANFASTASVAGTTIENEKMSSVNGNNGNWTAHGTYCGGTVAKADNLWYFSKDLFWKSSLLKGFTVVNVRPFRAYYTTTDQTKEAKAAVVYDDSEIVTTGITNVKGETAHTGKVYTIDGRYVGTSLEGLAPGLYIQDGRKVVKQ